MPVTRRQADAPPIEIEAVNSMLRVSISEPGPSTACLAEDDDAATPKAEYNDTDIVQEQPEMADDDSGSDDEPTPGKKKGVNQGRRKIDIEFIDDKNKRHITFSKRKAGIMKKAYELSTLTGTQVLLLVVSETGLVYTYTTPKLQPLVSGKRGKNLIQQCLVAPEDDAVSLAPDGGPTRDYPEPKVRQYAPNGKKQPTPRSPSKKRPPPVSTGNISDDEVPPVPAIPEEHRLPPSPTKEPISSVDSMFSTDLTAPLTPVFSMPSFAELQSFPSLNGLRSAYDPSLGEHPTTDSLSFTNPATTNHENSTSTPSSVVEVAPGTPRTLKKRRTVENLKSKKSSSNIKESAAKMLDASEKAAKALHVARNNACIETLLKAFNLQCEAQEQSNSKPRSPNPDNIGQGLHPVSTTLSELQMALSQMPTPSNYVYTQQGGYYDVAQSIQLSSSVESFVPLLEYFFITYVVNKKCDIDVIAQYAIDLTAFAAWLLGHAFIGTTIHTALTKACSGRKSNKNSPNLSLHAPADHALVSLPNGHPVNVSSPLGFDLPSLTYTLPENTFAMQLNNHHFELNPPPKPQQSMTRVSRAEAVFDEYCVFSKHRYQSHWERNTPNLQGTFIILALANSFMIVDEVTVSAPRDFLDANTPFKVRMSPIVNALLRRGDRLVCILQKARGSSFWLPTSSGSIIGNHLPEPTEYMPLPDLHAFEMEQCRLRDDDVGYAIASAAFNKATRASQLLALGEFVADEGFRPLTSI